MLLTVRDETATGAFSIAKEVNEHDKHARLPLSCCATKEWDAINDVLAGGLHTWHTDVCPVQSHLDALNTANGCTARGFPSCVSVGECGFTTEARAFIRRRRAQPKLGVAERLRHARNASQRRRASAHPAGPPDASLSMWGVALPSPSPFSTEGREAPVPVSAPLPSWCGEGRNMWDTVTAPFPLFLAMLVGSQVVLGLLVLLLYVILPWRVYCYVTDTARLLHHHFFGAYMIALFVWSVGVSTGVWAAMAATLSRLLLVQLPLAMLRLGRWVGGVVLQACVTSSWSVRPLAAPQRYGEALSTVAAMGEEARRPVIQLADEAWDRLAYDRHYQPIMSVHLAFALDPAPTHHTAALIASPCSHDSPPERPRTLASERRWSWRRTCALRASSWIEAILCWEEAYSREATWLTESRTRGYLIAWCSYISPMSIFPSVCIPYA